MGTILTDGPAEATYEPRETPEPYNRRLGRVVGLYYSEAPRTIVAMQCALVILSVYESRLKASWMFLGVARLQNWVARLMYLVFVLLVGFILMWGMR